MTRHFVLGNENILVGLDSQGQIRDFYYPHVGQENHVNSKVHRFGIWVDNNFSWFSSDKWSKKLSYKKDSLVSEVESTNHNLKIDLKINDAVIYNKNVFLRKVIIKNKTSVIRNVKLFFHQQFEISEANLGDTVYYNPFVKSIVHYKGKRYFLMNGCYFDKKIQGITNYATGLVGEYGREGTYKDAEDGHLQGNPIEHGSVDSTISFHLKLEPNSNKEIYFWICVGKKFKEVSELNTYILKKKPKQLLKETENYWRAWVHRTQYEFPRLSKKVINLFRRSLLVINTHVDKGGAIIASSDSDLLHLRKDTYNYMWPRDGALVARSLDRARYNKITENFFKFCNSVITEEGYLFHKYRPDGSLGSSWHSWLNHGHIQLPIQEDQLALVLDALWKHYLQHGEKIYIKKIFPTLVQRMAEFMLNFIDKKTGLPKESYDLWEEKLGIHTFTCSTVYAGFKAAANFEKLLGTKKKAQQYLQIAEKIKEAILKHLYDKKEKRFIKMVYYDGNKLKRDMTTDSSSTYGIFEFNVLDIDDPRVQSSMQDYLSRLKCNTSVGGYARYVDDNYRRVSHDVPGNPWFITTLWVAEYYIKKAKKPEDLQPVIEIFEWVAQHSLETGILAEQLNPHSGGPLSVAPLTWSHAAYVIAINKYLQKLDSLGVCKMCNPPKKEGP